MEPRFLTTIFCDDVRSEVGNKYSLMGCYDQKLLVAQFPTTLPKLCFVVIARTPSERPFKQLKFRLYRNEDLLAELEQEIPEPGMPDGPGEASTIPDSSSTMTARAVLQLTAVTFDAPCYFKVRALTEEGEPLRGGILQVDAIDHSAATPEAPEQLFLPTE